MSSWPGPTLADFVADAFFIGYEDDERLEAIVEILELARDGIERMLADYEEETHGSWRDYRNANADVYVTPAMEAQIQRS